MARKKKDGEMVVSIKPIILQRNFIQPVTIEDDFVTFVCFKHVEIEKVVDRGKKSVTEKDIGRHPLMLIYDGKELSWALCQQGQEIKINGEYYEIDRNIDDNQSLPREKFVGKLMVQKRFDKMMKEFKPQDFFDTILEYFERYFFMERAYLYRIVSMFAANMWVFDAHESTPYLFIKSPVKGCAKTHLGMSIAGMGNAEMSVGMKAHHVFRSVHGSKTTQVFDEIKKWSASARASDDVKDILELVNVGFQKGGSKVPRMIDAGKSGERRILYDSYSPKVMITTYGTLPSDTASRCIELMMQRAPPPDEEKGIPDYAERWYEIERQQTLEKIREMGLLFRLKYGREIYEISKSRTWREELDIKDVFKGISNRELEIFRPLIILTLKYMPEWKELIEIYIRKYIEMKSTLDPTPVNNVLFAMLTIYREAASSTYQSYEDDDGCVEILDDKIHGAVIHIPIKAIQLRIEAQTDLNVLGKNPASRIGLHLNELGFVSGKKRIREGYVRIIKVRQLQDMCMRYLGMPLGTEEDNQELSHAEKCDMVRDILLAKLDGLDMDELEDKVSGRMTTADLKSILKHYRTLGYIYTDGKKFLWNI